LILSGDAETVRADPSLRTVYLGESAASPA
jgi:hypothetical protein